MKSCTKHINTKTTIFNILQHFYTTFTIWGLHRHLKNYHNNWHFLKTISVLENIYIYFKAPLIIILHVGSTLLFWYWYIYIICDYFLIQSLPTRERVSEVAARLHLWSFLGGNLFRSTRQDLSTDGNAPVKKFRFPSWACDPDRWITTKLYQHHSKMCYIL